MSPIYIEGRKRTASIPSSTRMLAPVYEALPSWSSTVACAFVRRPIFNGPAISTGAVLWFAQIHHRGFTSIVQLVSFCISGGMP